MKMQNSQYKYLCICITDDALVVIGLCQSTKSVKPLLFCSFYLFVCLFWGDLAEAQKNVSYRSPDRHYIYLLLREFAMLMTYDMLIVRLIYIFL